MLVDMHCTSRLKDRSTASSQIFTGQYRRLLYDG